MTDFHTLEGVVLRSELGLKVCRVNRQRRAAQLRVGGGRAGREGGRPRGPVRRVRRESNVDPEAFAVGTTSSTTIRTPLLNSHQMSTVDPNDGLQMLRNRVTF
ncbi:hypothetical protein U5640_12090 [Streptomyces sp. SS7]|uniref:hypothetical protein n=1 Tax=Streptomyces sp. SS7 TaxID=3108485 RepID=UPI0030EE39D4